MTPFMHGFASELIKCGAFLRDHQEEYSPNYGKHVTKAMTAFHGTQAGKKLKQGPMETPLAPRRRTPTPFTTPNPMAGYAD